MRTNRAQRPNDEAMSQQRKYNKEYGGGSSALQKIALTRYQELLANQLVRENELKGLDSAYNRLFLKEKARKRFRAMYTAWWDSLERVRGMFKHRHSRAAGGWL